MKRQRTKVYIAICIVVALFSVGLAIYCTVQEKAQWVGILTTVFSTVAAIAIAIPKRKTEVAIPSEKELKPQNEEERRWHEFRTTFTREIDKCFEEGIYDEYITRTFSVTPNIKGQYFHIKSTWEFKSVSVYGKSPEFSFNINSKFQESQEYFHLLRYEINGRNNLSEAEGKIEKTKENNLYYVKFKEELPLENKTVHVLCEYEYYSTLPEYNVFSSYMYPAKVRNINVSIMGPDAGEWVLRANAFTAFKNLGNNINALYSKRINFTETKRSGAYNLSITDWTLPGTGVAFTAVKREHTKCNWLPNISALKLEK